MAIVLRLVLGGYLSAYYLLSDCSNLVIRRYDDESSDHSNLPNYLTTIYGLRG